jgi:hypothetical protein
MKRTDEKSVGRNGTFMAASVTLLFSNSGSQPKCILGLRPAKRNANI